MKGSAGHDCTWHRTVFLSLSSGSGHARACLLSMNAYLVYNFRPSLQHRGMLLARGITVNKGCTTLQDAVLLQGFRPIITDTPDLFDFAVDPAVAVQTFVHHSH